MRIPRRVQADDEILNMTSLIDLMFTLVLFFLVTTTFHQEERDIQVSLPETDITQSLSSAVKVIVINVRRDGSYYMGSRYVTVPEMHRSLLKAVKENPKQRVLVRGDREALHGYVAGAVAACKKAGIHDANIGYVVWGAGR